MGLGHFLEASALMANQLNPIYRSLTGLIEATMEEGRMFVRTIDFQGTSRIVRGSWMDLGVIDEQEQYQRWRNTTSSDGDRFSHGCIYHCLINQNPSSWRCEYRSEELSREIQKLTEERDAVLAKEIADRPKIEIRTAVPAGGE